ncbi:MAG: hypothetical protein MUO59_07915 [Actinobacteria bacterium]|nr:hypothetical protein [Actinomycetota bacterium]
MIRTSKDIEILEEIPKFEEDILGGDEGTRVRSFSVGFSIALIVFLNLIEISYFVYCVYYFSDIIVTIGSSVLVGYTLYTFLRFLPGIKRFIKKPFNYLTEGSEGYESIINYIMVSLEILFCSYILVRIVFLNFIL